MSGYVYIMASKKNGAVYIGVTSDLVRRVWEHKEGAVEGFTKTHAAKLLVHFEAFDDIKSAIVREKQLKKWNREWKLHLIEKHNPNWNDLYTSICG